MIYKPGSVFSERFCRSPMAAPSECGVSGRSGSTLIDDEITGVCGRWYTDERTGRLPEMRAQPVPSITVHAGAGRRRLPPLQPRARVLVVIGMFKRTRILEVGGGTAQRRLRLRE